ncbi:DNA-directed RNA polymerase subunit beta [Neobacillus sp. Marseille-QA0830]
MSVDNINQEQVLTREEYKRAKSGTEHAHPDSAQERTTPVKKGGSRQAVQENKTAKAAKQQKKRVRIRLLPIWLRLVLLMVFVVFSLVAGAVVGYSGLGGGKAADVFTGSTWTHIQDLVEKK